MASELGEGNCVTLEVHLASPCGRQRREGLIAQAGQDGLVAGHGGTGKREASWARRDQTGPGVFIGDGHGQIVAGGGSRGEPGHRGGVLITLNGLDLEPGCNL
jgi:hypothetical protein